MQTEQPVAEGLEKLEVKVHVPMFSAEDVVKHKDRRSRGGIPPKLIGEVLESWVVHQGWTKPVPEEFRCGLSESDFASLVYRYGHQKRMLPPEQWKPGWGRRPRKAGKGLESPRPNGERLLPHGAEGALHTLEENVSHLLRREKERNQLADDFRHHQKVATPATELSGRVSLMDQEIVRLAGIIELERTGNTNLLERIVKIENKLRGGGRKGPAFSTRLHRELRRRLRILIAGGK
ncbi:hypothetical protein LCGC14_2748160 [marine sediment metagenome]|uniref:Uncharacterized protein n=1 Tax=marine sediment metagenome TaxID=412755 RepID=A0A0F8ZPM8_9ZZZZ